MTSEEKQKLIIPWIDPNERVTVHFLDEQNLNAEVIACSDALVDLAIETRVPYMKQNISVPLSRTDVSVDPAHYTRDPDRPLKRGRLMLFIDEKRPAIVY